MYEGREWQVELLFVRGLDWMARIVFEGCSPAEVDAVCAGITIHAPLQPTSA